MKRNRLFDDVDTNIDKKQRTGFGLNSLVGKALALKTKRHSMKGPISLLAGHDGEIFTCKFHPSGSFIASAGSDRSIYMWSTKGDCENYTTIRSAHSHTITELQFSAIGDILFTCSADKTVIVWDAIAATRLKKLRGHQSYINSISVAPGNPHVLASVGDDCLINIWDLRCKRISKYFEERYQLTAVAFDKSGDQIFVGGIENSVNVWDIRQGTIKYKMIGHTDTITGLSLSPDGQHILSNSMDNTLKCWDIKPHSTKNSRLEKTFMGHQHNFEKSLLRCCWSPNQSMISAGSSDGLVHIWNFNSYDKIYELPGHRTSINEVVFSPKENLILSCSSDKQMYLREMDYDFV